MSPIPARWSAALCLLLAGCLPNSCSRTESRALFPSDSLSRAIAEATAIDTLVVSALSTGDFGHPRTLAFDADGRLFATDTERHILMRMDETGQVLTRALDSLKYPYLAGFRGGDPVVYSPDAHRLAAVDFDTGLTWSIPVPTDVPEQGLTYAAVTDSASWFKALGEEFDGYVARLDDSGNVTERIALPGPFWRHAGLLRSWQGDLLSLSGYRSVIYSVRGGILDSLDLVGFDSPMLARSRQFALGTTESPPLLTASAVGVDSLLFVLNMRPGWLNVDVYGPDGRLKRILTQPDPAFDKNFFPTDIAARALPDGAYEIAVTVTEPEAGIRRYRWAGFGR